MESILYRGLQVSVRKSDEGEAIMLPNRTAFPAKSVQGLLNFIFSALPQEEQQARVDAFKVWQQEDSLRNETLITQPSEYAWEMWNGIQLYLGSLQLEVSADEQSKYEMGVSHKYDIYKDELAKTLGFASCPSEPAPTAMARLDFESGAAIFKKKRTDDEQHIEGFNTLPLSSSTWVVKVYSPLMDSFVQLPFRLTRAYQSEHLIKMFQELMRCTLPGGNQLTDEEIGRLFEPDKAVSESPSWLLPHTMALGISGRDRMSFNVALTSPPPYRADAVGKWSSRNKSSASMVHSGWDGCKEISDS